MPACDRRQNGHVSKQFTVINYGRDDGGSDNVDDQDDVVVALGGPRRSTTHLRHGHLQPHAALHRPHAEHRPGPPRALPLSALTVEDELHGRSSGRRHHSGGHCTGAGAGPLAVGPPTTMTVARRRHWSDERDSSSSVVVDLLTETSPSDVVVVAGDVATVSDKPDAGDAESLLPATSVEDRRLSGPGDPPSSGSADSFRRTVDDARLPDVARRGRLFAKRYRRRLVLQSGVCNVSFANVDRRGARLLMDIFTTLLEMKWR